MPVIRDAIFAYAKTLEREFPPDRSASIGASEIGQCARKIWFLKNNQQRDNDYVDRWGATLRGQLIENYLWERALRSHFPKNSLHYAGRYQKTLFDSMSPLSCTPDGLVEDKGACFLVECKSADPRSTFAVAKPEHTAQVQVQMGIAREQTRYRPTFALLSYIDASFLDEIREFKIQFDEGAFTQLRRRAITIMDVKSADELRPEGYISGGAECQWCPFKHSCSAMRSGQVPFRENIELRPDQVEQLRTLASRRQDIKEDVEAFAKMQAELEEDIKELLRSNNARRVDVPGLRVVWSSLKGRPAWDWPKLREAAEAAGIDLEEFSTVGDPSDRLSIRFTSEEE